MILWIAGWVILSISLVNYMNIYQVALLRRNRELGVKKVLGEGSPNLWLDFWLENIIMVTGGVILAVVVIGGLAGWIEQEMGLPVRMDIRFVCFCVLGSCFWFRESSLYIPCGNTGNFSLRWR